MKKIIPSILILLVFLPVEYFFSQQAYYTVGWVAPGLFLFVSFISISLTIIFLVLDYRKTAIAILVSGVLIIVPFNIYYSNDWRILKEKSDDVVHWAYHVKLRTGSFPEKLTFKCDSRITYNREDPDNFGIHFYISTPNTGHFYTSKNGWEYMDD